MSTCSSCSAELKPEWKFCIHCGTPTIPGAVRPAVQPPKPWDPVAVFSLVLAVLASPLAALFGILALRRIRRSGERGRDLAIVATALGWIWLLAVVVLAVWTAVSIAR